MDDDNFHRFSSGLELANFIATSDLLEHSWKAITKVRSQINVNGSSCLSFFGHYNERPNCKIIAFVVSPNCTEDLLEGEGGGDLVSFSALKDEFPVFKFLCSKRCSDFAINGAALSLFRYFLGVYELEISRMELNSNTQLIITGHALGGSIASLFTLLLLDFLDFSKTNRPLCITFGSPLLGDEALQKAISQFSTWSSCFLHVVSNHDPLPRLFLNHRGYCPLGTFLLCSESGGCACSEDPTSISKLLEATTVLDIPPGSQLFDYKETVDRLINQANLKATTDLITENTESLRGSFIAQLEAIGVVENQPLQAQRRQNVDVNRLATVLIDGEMNMILEKTKAFDPSKTLNDIKINMAYLEWYKKQCRSNDIGYYDSYKNAREQPDIRVAQFKKILRVYWENMVEEAERRPQREGAPFNIRWLFGGTNYRRMVEPLDIAEHYRKGLDNYESHRSKHYMMLEEWFEKPTSDPSMAQREAVSSILTVDSCFWAHVEEAVLACQVLRMDPSAEANEAARAKLTDFEAYVVGLMKNYTVSPEIFLPQSTFMRWWEEYDEIVGDGYDSVLTRLMRDERYDEYANGRLEIH